MENKALGYQFGRLRGIKSVAYYSLRGPHLPIFSKRLNTARKNIGLPLARETGDMRLLRAWRCRRKWRRSYVRW